MKHNLGAISIMAGAHILFGSMGIWALVEWRLLNSPLAPLWLMLGPSQGALLGLWAAATFFALFLVCEVIWIVCSLFVVRRAGYRWIWRWRFHTTKQTTTSRTQND